MGLLERHLDTDLIDRIDAGWVPSQRTRREKSRDRRPRPLGTYRGPRRNAARGGAWSSSWYVPRHQANYIRDLFASFAKPPGRYPRRMAYLRTEWLNMKRLAREKLQAMLKARFGR